MTNEYFESYDKYLERMDYYNERKFICELTGHSCLTYFEAVESETTEAEQIIGNFPEPLKEPILRKVQFSQTSRLDTLVDDLYNALRQDFYPGETVIAKSNEQRIKVTIREKAKFNAITLTNGEVRPAYSRYRVELVSDPTQEMAVDDTQLTRDRKLFTKMILRTFIKHSVSRESWSGAPWLVKSKYAERYRIDTEVPSDLLKQNPHYQQMQERNKKLEARQKAREEKARELAELKARNLELKAEKKAQMLRNQQLKMEHRARLKGESLDPTANSTPYQSPQVDQTRTAWILPHDQSGYPHHQLNYSSDGGNLNPIQGPGMNNNDTVLPSLSTVVGNSIVVGAHNTPVPIAPAVGHGGVNNTVASVTTTTTSKKSLAQDDLLFIPSINAPKKATFNKETCLSDENSHLLSTLLETWLFLNVYHEPLLIDPFTFDDFVDVLRFADEEGEVPLLNEIHCALLSAIVGVKNSELLISMPYDDKEDEEKEEIIEEVEGEPDSELAKDNSADTTEDKMNIDNEQNGKGDDDDDDKIEPTGENGSPSDDTSAEHRASSFVRYQNVDWKERLKKRMFKDGGWQQITICVLHSVAYVSGWTDTINEILSFMASSERGVTLSGARAGYYELSFALRIRVLEILCHLVYSSSLIRAHIDTCLEASTKLRKERMDRQRETKLLVETLRSLETEKKNFIADEIAAQKKTNDDSDEKSNGHIPVIDELEIAKNNQAFKRVYDDCEKITHTIEEYAEMNKKCEEELIRLDCQRLRLLGKDRYYNRYWWFESNGMKRPERLDIKKENANENERVKEEENGVKVEENKDGEVTEPVDNGDDKIKVKKEEYQEKEKEEEQKTNIDVKEADEQEEDEDEEEEDEEEEKPISKSKSKSRRGKNRSRKNTARTRSKKKQEPTPEESEVESQSEAEEEESEAEKVKNKSESKDEGGEEEVQGEEISIDENETEDEEQEEPVGYAMGRLWIQGPTEEDALVYLSKGQSRLSTAGDIDPEDGIAPGVEMTPWDLKQKNEGPVFLRSHTDWGYYDKPEEIEALVQWLNPLGRRESKLLKEFNNIKPFLLGSIAARKEDIEADKLSQLHEIDEVVDQELGIISDDDEELDGDSATDKQNGEPAAVPADSEDSTNEPEIPPEEEDYSIGRRRLRSRNSDTNSHVEKDATRHRGRGRPSKRIALDKEAIARERQKRLEHKKNLREQKELRRQELISKLSSKVPSRVLNWTNSIVEQELGHSHYEGPMKKRGPRRAVNVHKEWTNEKRR